MLMRRVYPAEHEAVRRAARRCGRRARPAVWVSPRGTSWRRRGGAPVRLRPPGPPRTRQPEQHRRDPREVADAVHLGRGLAEPQQRDRRHRVITRPEVLRRSRDRWSPAANPPGRAPHQRAQEAVQELEDLERVRHGPRVAGLVGLEELEDGQVVGRGEAQQDPRRLLCRARRELGSAVVGPGAGDVVGQRLAAPGILPREEAPSGGGVGHHGRGLPGPSPAGRSGTGPGASPSACRYARG